MTETSPEWELFPEGFYVTLDVRFTESSYDLRSMVYLLEALDDLWVDMVQLDMYGRLESPIPDRDNTPRPLLQRLSLQSPLAITLAAGGGGSGLLIGAFLFVRFALRHAKDIGGFIPSVIQGWHENWSGVERAKADRALDAALRANKADAAASMPGGPVEKLQARIADDTARLAQMATPDTVDVTGSAPIPDLGE